MSLLTHVFWGNPVYLYLISLVVVVLSFLVGRLIRRYGRGRLRIRARATETRWDDLLASLLDTPLSLFATVLGIYLAVSLLEMPDAAQTILKRGLVCIITVFVILTALRLINEIFTTIVTPRVRRTESRIDDQVSILFRKLAVALVWIFGVLIILSNLGYNVFSLLTGLGLGGLAVAMAAKDTLANILGGITILADRPIEMGQTVRISGVEGRVEEIGLRTTRVRTYEGHLVSIPNSRAADSILENLSARHALRVRFLLGLSYDTPSDKLLEVESLIQEAVRAVPGVSADDEVSAYLLEFAASSLNFQVTYYIDETANSFAVRHAVNTGILKKLDEQGMTIPFTTYTILQQGAVGQSSPSCAS